MSYPCTECNGNGYWQREGYESEGGFWNDGSWVACHKCRGCGWVKCRLINIRLDSKGTCPSCSGKGSLLIVTGTLVYERRSETCWDCNGVGVLRVLYFPASELNCSRCQGKGSVDGGATEWYPSGREVPGAPRKQLTCPMCKGRKTVSIEPYTVCEPDYNARKK